jgi:phenylacetate-CoA ligase
MDWAEFQGSPADFYNPAAPSPALQRLRYPTNHQIRTAVLGPRLVESSAIKVFNPGWIEPIREFRPEALAGPVAVLMQLAEAASQARQTIPTVTRAIVAFTGLEHGALTEAGRDALWQVFQVPIFEQYLGADGSLLAWECEAHEGLHTVEDNAIIEQSPDSELILTSLTDRRRPTIRLVTSLAARLDSGECECGQPGPRLISVSP